MRALVLGASGHLGNAITRELLQRGWQVTATSRQAEPAVNLVGLPIDYRIGDGNRPEQIDRWVRGHELIVDAAAPYAFWLDDQASPTRAIELAGRRTRQLIESALHHRAALAFISSFTTLPRDRRGLDAAQGKLLRAIHPYFALKKHLEELVLEGSAQGLRAVVVNPTLCLGPYDLKPPQFCLIPVTVKGELPAVNSHPVNVIDVRDVATATVEAFTQEHFGVPIPLSGHNTTVDSLTAAICRIAGVAAPALHLPAPLPAVAAYGNEFLVRAGLSSVEYPSVGMLLLLEQYWTPPAPVRGELLPKLRPMSQMIAEGIDWYRDAGHLDAPSTATMGLRAG